MEMIPRPWAAVLVWGLVLGAAGFVVLTTTHIKTDLSFLLPPARTHTQQLLLDQVREGPTSRLILVGLEGANTKALASASRKLAAWMRESGEFVYVANGEQAWSTEGMDLLFRYRYLLSPLVTETRFEQVGLRRALQDRLRDLTSPISAMVKGTVSEDPTGEFRAVLQSWIPEMTPRRYHGVWFSSDDRRALLLGETQASGFALDDQQRLQEKLELAFAQIVVSSRDPQLMQLVMSGPAIFSVEARKTIKQEAWRLTAVAVILVIPVLYTAYRSIRLVALSVLPLATGIAVATAAVGLLFGFVHGITLAFGVTLIGVAVDYPIHMFSHLGRESPAETVFQKIWATMGLGIATTALGFSALLLTGFPGLSQLGCFAILGLVVAGAVTRYVLPVFIPLGFAPASYTIRLTPLVDGIRRAYWMLPLTGIVAIGYLTLSETTLWERDLANLSPISNEEKMLDRELRKELAAPDVREVVVITGETEQEVIEISEGLQPVLDRLISEDALAGYEMAARHLPSWKKQRVRQTALPNASDLRSSLEGALIGLPFKENLFDPFVDAVGMAKRQQPLGIAHLNGTGLGLRLQSLLFTRGGRWVALVLLRGVTQRDLLVARLSEWNPPHVTYVDLKNESNRLVTAYRNETSSIVGWGVLAIAIILLLGLRSVVMTLRVLLPIALSILLVIAFLHGIGERLSLFHLASLLLVVGIGVDYALFLSRSTSTVAERERTVFAVLICSVTTMLVSGVLAFSELPVLKAIGMTAACGSLFSLLSSAMLSRGHVAVDSSA